MSCSFFLTTKVIIYSYKRRFFLIKLRKKTYKVFSNDISPPFPHDYATSTAGVSGNP